MFLWCPFSGAVFRRREPIFTGKPACGSVWFRLLPRQVSSFEVPKFGMLTTCHYLQGKEQNEHLWAGDPPKVWPYSPSSEGSHRVPFQSDTSFQGVLEAFMESAVGYLVRKSPRYSERIGVPAAAY